MILPDSIRTYPNERRPNMQEILRSRMREWTRYGYSRKQYSLAGSSAVAKSESAYYSAGQLFEREDDCS